MENLITTAEAARILGKSVSTVCRDAQLGYLPVHQKLPGQRGAYLFDRAAIQAHADRKRADQATGISA